MKSVTKAVRNPQQPIPSKESGWKKLQGAAAGTDLIKLFAAHKKRERRHGR
ncbi:MAG: hypothetical protein LAO55_01080 [Acidobacteriia bacterium]|nr:hypothetical protein [Terriglobia bacterium]